jgi:hypothetical protein
MGGCLYFFPFFTFMPRIVTTYGSAAAIFAVVLAFLMSTSSSQAPYASADEPPPPESSSSSESSYVSAAAPARFICRCDCVEPPISTGTNTGAYLCATSSGALNQKNACDKKFDFSATGGTVCSHYDGKACEGYRPTSGDKKLGIVRNCYGPIGTTTGASSSNS